MDRLNVRILSVANKGQTPNKNMYLGSNLQGYGTGRSHPPQFHCFFSNNVWHTVSEPQEAITHFRVCMTGPGLRKHLHELP